MAYNLESDRLYYREITENDADIILKWRNSQEVRNNSFFQNIVTKENHSLWYDKYIKTGKRIQFIFSNKENNIDIGCVYLSDFEHDKNTAEYGIFIGEKSNYNRGYGTEVTKTIIDFSFNILNISTLYLSVFERNIGAIESYEKAGFKRIRTDNQLINNKYENVIYMNIRK